ncbi:MAG: hypothetical protein GY736_05890 [Sphingomonas sp.]|uniref:hypothetical protein n=1 Tax=Sphingomonas sp. TaxID=28214 RepID=UPI00258F010F|nr:hypothetical protein [Sphingomonas sp.]MCP4025830.1 hypothetical protein [Sphingomonas sp.]
MPNTRIPTTLAPTPASADDLRKMLHQAPPEIAKAFAGGPPPGVRFGLFRFYADFSSGLANVIATFANAVDGNVNKYSTTDFELAFWAMKVDVAFDDDADVYDGDKIQKILETIQLKWQRPGQGEVMWAPVPYPGTTVLNGSTADTTTPLTIVTHGKGKAIPQPVGPVVVKNGGTLAIQHNTTVSPAGAVGAYLTVAGVMGPEGSGIIRAANPCVPYDRQVRCCR